MLSGQSGEMPIRYRGQTNHVYFAPVERTGWSLSIVLPEKELYSGVRRIGMIVKLLQLLGLVLGLLILILLAGFPVLMVSPLVILIFQHINDSFYKFLLAIPLMLLAIVLFFTVYSIVNSVSILLLIFNIISMVAMLFYCMAYVD